MVVVRPTLLGKLEHRLGRLAQLDRPVCRGFAERHFTSPAADGGNVFDPCFGADNGDGLACPIAPWSGSYLKIGVVGQSEETSGSETAGRPWGYQLRNGNRCSALGGATDSIKGKRLNYACEKGGVIYGDPLRGRVWRVYFT
ncbi:hypothetical protein ABEG17_06465 [Pedococcus sp. KACC 23699]|uniref:Uncharacterized protein n=1 Tax=Pedococcus sp. KACC 23699 TaxID=3149228 RepID=A0AAU7JX26_9MICO